MRIVIDPFDESSIAAAVERLKQYERDFKAKETEFVRRLKEIGVSVARAGFAAADYDGENDVLIAETQMGGNAMVIAYGQAVGFIEFGTGVRFREYDSSASDFTPPPHGSYGKGRGKNPKGWYFNPDHQAGKRKGVRVPARHTYGNPPAEAMLAARDAIVEQIVQIAREVWK